MDEMARDFDIRPKSRVQTTAPKTKPKEVRTKTPVSQKRVGWVTFIVILAIAATLTAAYYQSLQPKSPTQTIDQNQTENVKEELVVKIYDGGAGESETKKAVTTLKDNGYQVEELGKSQFTYDKTFVWYVTGHQEEAQKIGNLLVGRNIVYKESRISGSFIIQIQMGNQ